MRCFVMMVAVRHPGRYTPSESLLSMNLHYRLFPSPGKDIISHCIILYLISYRVIQGGQ